MYQTPSSTDYSHLSQPHQDAPTNKPPEQQNLFSDHPTYDIHTPTPTPSKYRNFPWWSVWWRLWLSVFFGGFLFLILFFYDRKKQLDTWDRRVFNSLMILATSLVSMSLGSLLWVLGAALRWPLLARRRREGGGAVAHQYPPRQVDLILGMHAPSIAFRMVAHQARHRSWSPAMLAGVAYLALNVVSRLSVAVFGFTYNLNEEVQIHYPVMATDFGSEKWVQWKFDYPEFERTTRGHRYEKLNWDHRKLSTLAFTALADVPLLFDSSVPSTYDAKNINGSGVDRHVDVDAKNVTYTYRLREWRGLQSYLSPDIFVRSSSTCSNRVLNGTGIYENGQLVAGLSFSNTTKKPLILNDTIRNSEYTDSLASLLSMAPQDAAVSRLWGILHTPGHGYDKPYPDCLPGCIKDLHLPCVKSYLLGMWWPRILQGSFFECTTCLTDRDGNPGLGDEFLFNYPPADSSYATRMLLTFGAASSSNGDRMIKTDHGLLEFHMYENDLSGLSTDFVDGLEWLPPNDQDSPKIPEAWDLTAAHLAARLPILALLGAQQSLPHAPRDPDATEYGVVITTLHVKWERAISVLCGVLALQLLPILVVWWMTRGVPVLEHDSAFAVARLLRTAMSTVQGGSLARAKDLAEGIGKAAGGRMGFGTRRWWSAGTGETYYEADLWNDVEKEFPKGEKYI